MLARRFDVRATLCSVAKLRKRRSPNPGPDRSTGQAWSLVDDIDAVLSRTNLLQYLPRWRVSERKAFYGPAGLVSTDRRRRIQNGLGGRRIQRSWRFGRLARNVAFEETIAPFGSRGCLSQRQSSVGSNPIYRAGRSVTPRPAANGRLSATIGRFPIATGRRAQATDANELIETIDGALSCRGLPESVISAIGFVEHGWGITALSCRFACSN